MSGKGRGNNPNNNSQGNQGFSGTFRMPGLEVNVNNVGSANMTYRTNQQNPDGSYMVMEETYNISQQTGITRTQSAHKTDPEGNIFGVSKTDHYSYPNTQGNYQSSDATNNQQQGSGPAEK